MKNQLRRSNNKKYNLYLLDSNFYNFIPLQSSTGIGLADFFFLNQFHLFYLTTVIVIAIRNGGVEVERQHHYNHRCICYRQAIHQFAKLEFGNSPRYD